MSEERISIQELKKIYGVTEKTIGNWVKSKNLPLIQITPQQKYIYKKDLILWEKSFCLN